MNENHSVSTSHYRCFRCQSGCIHLVCGNTMLVLTQEQFLSFADSVNAMHHQIVVENGPTTNCVESDTLVM
jgi:hypothetical protein